MIYGYLYQGSGVGNQLHRMIATRVKALDLDVDWRLIYVGDNSGKVEGFKCKDFMEFDESKVINYFPDAIQFNEKKVVENGVDTRSYDPEWNFIEDNTIINGEFQDERYWEYREKEVNEWLKVEPLEMPDDLCVIGFRGGEFKVFPDLFLPKKYWDKGIKIMREINPKMRFEVHTDDKETAKQFFPDFKVIHDIGINWRSMRYAHYSIIANSSFFILPRWLKSGEESIDDTLTICPRFWARHNIKVWCLPQNYYRQFLYI